jgi:hypothetical protein
LDFLRVGTLERNARRTPTVPARTATNDAASRNESLTMSALHRLRGSGDGFPSPWQVHLFHRKRPRQTPEVWIALYCIDGMAAQVLAVDGDFYLMARFNPIVRCDQEASGAGPGRPHRGDSKFALS